MRYQSLQIIWSYSGWSNCQGLQKLLTKPSNCLNVFCTQLLNVLLYLPHLIKTEWEKAHRRTAKITGMEYLPCEGRLCRPGLFSPEKLQYVTEAYKTINSQRSLLFIFFPCGTIRVQPMKLAGSKFTLNKTGWIFIPYVVKLVGSLAVGCYEWWPFTRSQEDTV